MWIHPQTHQHTTITTTLPSHTQNGYNKRRFYFILFLFFKLTQPNSLCPYIWIDTDLDFVSFGKVTGFQGIHFVLSLDFISFRFMYKQSFLSFTI